MIDSSVRSGDPSTQSLTVVGDPSTQWFRSGGPRTSGSAHTMGTPAAADISVPTIKRLEPQDGPLGGRDETGDKIRLALESAGVEFIDENGGGPGVRLRKRHQKKS
jgi:hypothetical protein